MPPAQKPAGAEGAERTLPREQPVTADAATPTPANKGSASAAGAEGITMENDDLLTWPWRIELARSFRDLRASELVFPEQF